MPRPRVVILDISFPDADAERRLIEGAGAELAIHQCHTEDEVIIAGRAADAVIVQYAPLTRRSIPALARCRIISRYGIGTDNIDIPAASAHGIWVANVPGFCVPEVSDAALAMVLACGRRLFAYDHAVRNGVWDAIATGGGMPRLSESTLGVIGFGAIGRALAQKASALGLRVLAHSPRSAARHAAAHGAEAVDLERLLRESDYVVLLCPLNAQTRHLIDRRTLALMKATAHLVNVSRGGLVDEPALVDALERGRLAGAALDVAEREPVPDDSPLRRLPNVILTPHAAYYSTRAQHDLQERAAQNVVDVLQGRRPASLLNPEVELPLSAPAGG